MTKDVELRIEGMSCGHCVKAVREALQKVPGVSKVDVEVGRAHLVTDESVARDTLASALEDAGYSIAG